MSVRARKHHTCCRCGNRIAKGAIHESWTWFEPGERPVRCHAHVLCDRLDIGRDCDNMLDESFGIEEWHERLARFAPEGWFDGWGNHMVWPPVFHDELVALLGGAS